MSGWRSADGGFESVSLPCFTLVRETDAQDQAVRRSALERCEVLYSLQLRVPARLDIVYFWRPFKVNPWRTLYNTIQYNDEIFKIEVSV